MEPKKTPLEEFHSVDKKDYGTARTLLTILLPWMMIGMLPRIAGIATSKLRFATFIYWTDILISVVILGSLLWSMYCIYFNARLRMKHDSPVC